MERLRRWVEACDAGAPALCRVDGLVAAGVLVLCVLASILCSRGRVGVAPVTYGFVDMARRLQATGSVDGAAFSLGGVLGPYATPHGYPALMALLMAAGVSGLRAAWAVSVLSYGAAVGSCVYLFARRFLEPVFAAMAVVLFALNPTVLQWSCMGTSEMLYVFLTVLAALAFDRFHCKAAGSRAGRGVWSGVLLGVLLGVPFWTRYIGLVMPLVYGALLLILWVFVPGRRVRCVAALGAAGLVVLALFVRNAVLAGSLWGHPMGAAPGDTFAEALVRSFWNLGLGWCPPLAGVMSRAVKLFVAGCVALGTALTALTALLALRYAGPAVYPAIYLLMLAYSASHTRIDPISLRFVLPVFPFLAVCVAALCRNLRMRFRGNRLVPRVLMALAALVTTYIAVTGAAAVVKGQRPRHGNYSPLTIAYVMAHVPPGTSIAVNRFGGQMAAYSSAYPSVLVPWDDNEGYNRAYGLQSWSRRDALRAFIEKDIRYVVFFMGPDNDDPFLQWGSYGNYVASLYAGEVPEAQEIVRLPDGVVVVLAPSPKLTQILSGLPAAAREPPLHAVGPAGDMARRPKRRPPR